MTPERLIIENLFRIVDKDGNDLDFKLNSAQAKVDSSLTGRDIIPKARQEGVSSYFLARATARCLSTRNTRAVVISHETEATQRMLAKVHYFLEHIRGPRAVIKNFSKNEVSFPKTNSVIYIGTAGSRQFGRGDTITNLHCSEVAFWPDPKKLLTGLFQAVPASGEISLESTGNGVGNYFHRACMRASAGQSRYHVQFLPWHDFEDYRLKLDDNVAAALLSNLDEGLDEPRLVEQFKLSAGQLAWRRMKIEELDFDLDMFKQEYPMTLDECFQATGCSVFSVGNYVPVQHEWRRSKEDTRMHELAGHPRQDHAYVIGVDTSGGVGRDNSVIQVVDATALEQVCEWVSDKTAPDVLAQKVASLGIRYNNALVNVESNNHGIVTLKELTRINAGQSPMYPIAKIFRAERSDSLLDLGTRTTVQTKPLMIGKLRKLLINDLKIHSPELMDELSTFIETENGSMEADVDCKDDRVMALALCMYAFERALMDFQFNRSNTVLNKSDPFTLNNIIKELEQSRHMFPISDGLFLDVG